MWDGPYSLPFGAASAFSRIRWLRFLVLRVWWLRIVSFFSPPALGFFARRFRYFAKLTTFLEICHTGASCLSRPGRAPRLLGGGTRPVWAGRRSCIPRFGAKTATTSVNRVRLKGVLVGLNVLALISQPYIISLIVRLNLFVIYLS